MQCYYTIVTRIVAEKTLYILILSTTNTLMLKNCQKPIHRSVGNTLSEWSLFRCPVDEKYWQLSNQTNNYIDILYQEFCLLHYSLHWKRSLEIERKSENTDFHFVFMKVKSILHLNEHLEAIWAGYTSKVMESFDKIHDCCGSDVSNGVFGRILRKCIQEIITIENHLSFGLAVAVALCIFTFLKWMQR